MNADDVIGVGDVADLYDVSKNTIYHLCKRNALPHFRVGQRICFHVSTLETWMEAESLSDLLDTDAFQEAKDMAEKHLS